MAQLSHLYMTNGKTITLTIQTFVAKVLSLVFNTLSRFVIAFLPRNVHLNFMAAVTIHSDFGLQVNKICHYFHFSPLFAICFIDYAKAFDCVDHNKLENYERDGNTRPPDLPLEKFVCRSGSNS